MSTTTNRTPTETTGATTTAGGSVRFTAGLIAVIAGLATILAALWIAVRNFDTAADVGAVLGLIAAPVSAIIAAYFGISATKEASTTATKTVQQANAAATQRVEEAHAAAIAYAGALDPAEAKKVANTLPPAG